MRCLLNPDKTQETTLEDSCLPITPMKRRKTADDVPYEPPCTEFPVEISFTAVWKKENWSSIWCVTWEQSDSSHSQCQSPRICHQYDPLYR
jgi:hypothetical protein